MLTAIFLAACVFGTIAAGPYDEFRSNLEFLSGDTNLDEPAYRLLPDVQPLNVYVELDTYPDESRFNGFVRILIDVQRQLNQVVFHQNVVSIQSVTVRDSNDGIVHLNLIQPYETDDYYELIKINFEEALEVGTYSIEITYLGQINENPLDRGFYKGYYFLGTEKRYYATTQFQPYHARKAFPCFDEPQFKARYVISITRPSSFSQSYSNMAIRLTEDITEDRTRETFYPTPLISAYLIAFHVSEFVETNATGTDEKPFGIVSRPGDLVIPQHGFAARTGVDITEWMDDYFGINYYDMGDGVDMKNDHIALPDFPSGAMENWGMVNYREAYLLYDEHNTNIISKTFIATIIAHEMAHKWFGNLVTCFWWSNLWLNESFASFFEYFGAHGAAPELELDSQFIVDYVHSALWYDAGAGATPMNWTGVVDNPSITAHFSTASYAKGASVLRMMEHFVGPDTFKKALHYYLLEKSYQIGTPQDLYDAFKKAVEEDSSLSQYGDIDIEEVFDSWVQNAGAPVLHVTVDNEAGLIRLTQNRYSLTGSFPGVLWQIPLTYTHEGAIDFENTKPSHIMTGPTYEIPKPTTEEAEWVIFNVRQSGYYRVMYDNDNWLLIRQALLNNTQEINEFNRAQIVNDVLVFLRGNDAETRMTSEFTFEIINFLKNETNYYVWAAALGHFEWIRRRFDHIPSLQAEFETYLLTQMEYAINDLGFVELPEDTTSRILNRMQILNFACNIDHEECVEDSKRLWDNFKNDNTPVPVNHRRYVYCMGLRNGDRSDYDRLFNLYTASENTADMVIILRALACTKNEAALNDYLQQSLSNDRIRIHDRTNAFLYALQGNPENIKVVLQFLETNYENIRLHYGGSARLAICINSLSTFLTDFDDIVKFQTWLYGHQEELEDVFANGVSVITTSLNNILWTNNIAVNFYDYLRTYNSASGITVSCLLLFVTVVINMLKN